MHPFLDIYDLQPLKAHPLVFAPGVPVIAQVVGTERYTSGSKVSHQLIPGKAGEGVLAQVEGWVGPEGILQISILLGGNLYSILCSLDSWRLYLDDQEEIPTLSGATSGPPETQSLDESAPSGSVSGIRLLLVKGTHFSSHSSLTPVCLSCPLGIFLPQLCAAPPPLSWFPGNFPFLDLLLHSTVPVFQPGWMPRMSLATPSSQLSPFPG